LVFLVSGGLIGNAQELTPRDRSIIDGLDRSSVVVIGNFSVGWCLPWFDGWHCSAAIHVEEFLYGDQKPDEFVVFRWTEPYGQTCFICDKVSWLDGIKGIWFLARKGGVWQFSGTMAVWCDGPLSMKYRDAVLRVIRQRSTM
jgi:hypothetical protein